MDQQQEAPVATGRDAVDKLSKLDMSEDRDRAKVSPAEVDAATAWFLSDEDAGPAQHTFEINVSGNPDKEKFVPWTVQAISRDRIRQIRKMSKAKGRAAAQTGETDDMQVNLRIAAEGTLKPDLRQIALDHGLPEPAMALGQRMSHKPGLIDQIAGEVLTVSGYDDEDIREVSAARS